MQVHRNLLDRIDYLVTVSDKSYRYNRTIGHVGHSRILRLHVQQDA